MGNPLLHAIGQSEELGRDAAGNLYRQLLEKGSPDPKSVGQMKQAMEVLGLTLTDASHHLRLRQDAKSLQQRITNGAGLQRKMEDAKKALKAGVAKKLNFLEQWNRQHNQRLY